MTMPAILPATFLSSRSSSTTLPTGALLLASGAANNLRATDLSDTLITGLGAKLPMLVEGNIGMDMIHTVMDWITSQSAAGALELPKSIVTGALLGALGYVLGGLKERRHIAQLNKGLDLMHVGSSGTFVMPVVGDGSRKFIRLTGDGVQADLSELISNKVDRDFIINSIRDRSHTNLNNAVINLDGEQGRRLKHRLLNEFTSSFGTYGKENEFLIFITCEDPDNTLKGFASTIRFLYLPSAQIDLYADPKKCKELLLADPNHAFRIYTMHRLAFFHKNNLLPEGQKPAVRKLRIDIEGMQGYRMDQLYNPDFVALRDSGVHIPLEWHPQI